MKLDKTSDEKVQAVLIWKDNSRTAVYVPVGAATVTCGDVKFHLQPVLVNGTNIAPYIYKEVE